MPLSRPKIASLVASQVPEFVREDYATFISFLEAYYEYLETESGVGVELHSIRDIDTTLEAFLKHFRNEVATNIPYSVVNERFLLSHIKDQYLAKGSEASFKLLFRLLFNKEVTVEYPAKQMLRASDGKWNQDVSIFARVNAGTPDMIVGKMVDVVTATRTLRLLVDRRQIVEIEVDRVVQIAEGVYEFYVDRRFFGNVSISDRLRYNNEFDATVLATTSKITIQQGGRNFKAGQLYTIKNGNGNGTVLKIKSVDSLGSIISAEFIKYGVGYETDFTSTFMAQSGQITTGSGATAFNISSGAIGIFETTNGFTEQGVINRTDYNLDAPGEQLAWDGTYSGENVREFYSDNAEEIINPEDPAIIKITLGALAKYPGYFKNNDGFLDDAIYIQDGRYYQAFSYVIKIDERLDDYRSAVKTLIHPAGMALFGEYDIRNEFDLEMTLESMVKILAVAVQDAFVMQDSKTLLFGKALSDSFGTTELTMKGFSKSLTGLDSAVPTDAINSKLFGKALTDSQSIADTSRAILFGKSLTDSQSVVEGISAKSFDKALADSQSFSDATTSLFSKSLTGLDSAEPTDAINSKLFGKSAVDSQGLDDGISAKSFGKALADSQIVVDGISAKSFDKALTDSQIVVDAQTRAFSKSLTGLDSTTPTDAISSKSVTKGFTDSQSFSDTQQLLFSKLVDVSVVGYNDIVSPNDANTLSFEKNVIDTATPTDDQTRAFSKSLTGLDSTEPTDAIDTKLFSKSLTDAQAITDAPSTRVFSKVINPSVIGYNDIVSLSDNDVFTFTKYVIDAVASADSSSFSLNKSIQSEIFSTTDTGSVLLNPYADTSYFLEDFAGIPITF